MHAFTSGSKGQMSDKIRCTQLALVPMCTSRACAVEAGQPSVCDALAYGSHSSTTTKINASSHAHAVAVPCDQQRMYELTNSLMPSSMV